MEGAEPRSRRPGPLPRQASGGRGRYQRRKVPRRGRWLGRVRRPELRGGYLVAALPPRNLAPWPMDCRGISHLPCPLRAGAPPRPRRVWRRAFPASQPEDWLPRGVRTPIGVKWGLPGGPQASDWTSVPRRQRPLPSHAFPLPAGEPSFPCQVICTFSNVLTPNPHLLETYVQDPKTHGSSWRGSATQATPLRISPPG